MSLAGRSHTTVVARTPDKTRLRGRAGGLGIALPLLLLLPLLPQKIAPVGNVLPPQASSCCCFGAAAHSDLGVFWPTQTRTGRAPPHALRRSNDTKRSSLADESHLLQRVLLFWSPPRSPRRTRKAARHGPSFFLAERADDDEDEGEGGETPAGTHAGRQHHVVGAVVLSAQSPLKRSAVVQFGKINTRVCLKDHSANTEVLGGLLEPFQ